MNLVDKVLVMPKLAAELQCGALSNVGGQNLCRQTSLEAVINIIANWAVGLIGGVLAIVILISAIQYITSAGSPDRVKSAKDRMVQAAVSLGLLISFRAIIALFSLLFGAQL